MIISGFILFAVTLAATIYAYQRKPEAIVGAAQFTRTQALRLALRLPFALISASCLAALIPDDTVAALIGERSGIVGIAIASFVGGLMPGGPMVSFPVVLLLAGEGAGTAQLVSLITGWSIFAIHRVISYESTMLGWKFVGVRIGSSLLIPFATGLAAAGLMNTMGQITAGAIGAGG